MTLGILARIEDDRYEVVDVSTTDSGIETGSVFPVDRTFCSEVVRYGGPLQFEDVLNTEYRTHPCYEEFKIRAYIGMPVLLRDQPYGTLNFSSRISRARPFTPTDLEILKLMAQWIGTELQLRQEQAKLLQAEKLSSIGLLASGVAHEVNNPLAGVLAGIEAFRQGTVPPERRKLYLDTMADGLQRIRNIVQSLLDYARHRQPNATDVDVHQVLTSSLRLIQPSIRNKKLTVDNQFDAESTWIRSDRSQFMQAVVNVLLNAIHAAPENSTITVARKEKGSLVGVRVLDQGPGIPKEILAKICDPFFTTKPEGEGTGLGLSITLSVVRANGGELGFDNAGGGAAVTLWLPVGRAAMNVDRPPDPVAAVVL